MFQKLKSLVSWVDQDYGMKIITGQFWRGKSKYSYMEAFLRKQQNPDWILISNVPYKNIDWESLVDIFFNSKQDLAKVLECLKYYIDLTNTEDILQEMYFPPIRLIIDEAHVYFPARWFKEFNADMFDIMTQCRKRSILITFITQEIPQLDKAIRRLVPEVISYEPSTLWLVRKRLYLFKSTEQSDIANDFNVTLLSSRIILRDWIRLLFNRDLQAFFDQRFLTLYVCWLHSVFELSYQSFFKLINDRRLYYLDFVNQKDVDNQDNSWDNSEKGHTA